MMNPYAVLGVPENASEAQIKDAYRALARKYQDDTLQGGPLADIARQKMAELDAAYESARCAGRRRRGVRITPIPITAARRAITIPAGPIPVRRSLPIFAHG